MNQIKRINSIDLFRLYCSVLVVAIHTQPFAEINGSLGYFVSQVLSRIAVPFFFCVSGYYYIKKLEEGTFCTKEMFLKLFKIYLFWTCIYYARDFCLYVKTMSIVGIIHTFIVDFFINGSSYHFWYLVGLLFSILFVGAIYKLRLQKYIPFLAIALYMFGLLGCSYTIIGNRIPGVSTIIQSSHFLVIRRVLLMGVPFFCLGGSIDQIYKATRNHAHRNLVVSAVLFVLEIIVINKLNLGTNIIITIFLPVLLVTTYVVLLEHPLPTYTTAAKQSHSLANYMYYSHPLMIWILNFVSPIKNVNTLLFMSTLIFCVASWYLLDKSRNTIVRRYII